MAAAVTLRSGLVTIRLERGVALTFGGDEPTQVVSPEQRVREACLAAGVVTFSQLSDSTKRAAFLAALDPNG